jgi:hypothetical protein
MQHGRSRSIRVDSNGNNSVELFVGRNENYKGDESIFDENFSISIQIHSITPKNIDLENPLLFGAIKINHNYNFKTVDHESDN